MSNSRSTLLLDPINHSSYLLSSSKPRDMPAAASVDVLVCCTGYSKLSKQPNKRSKVTEALAAICSKGQEPNISLKVTLSWKVWSALEKMVLTQQLPTASEEVFPWSLSLTQAADRGVYHHHAGTRRSTLIAKRTKAKQFEEITRLHAWTYTFRREVVTAACLIADAKALHSEPSNRYKKYRRAPRLLVSTGTSRVLHLPNLEMSI